jgi:hypothetical protein
MVLAPLTAAVKKPNHDVVPVNSWFFEMTYKELSAEWWKWVFSIPKSSNLSLMMNREIHHRSTIRK